MTTVFASGLARSFSSAVSTYTVLRGWLLEIELKIQKYRQGRKDATGRQMLAIDRWGGLTRIERKTKLKIDKKRLSRDSQ